MKMVVWQKRYRQQPEIKEKRRKQSREYSQRFEVKKRIHKYRQTPEVKKKEQEYRQRPEVKERKLKYNQRPEVKERRRKHNQRPEVKERRRKHQQSFKAKEWMRIYNQRPDVKKRSQKKYQKSKFEQHCKLCGNLFFTNKRLVKYCSMVCAWKDKEYNTKMRKSRALKPNGQEKELNRILQRLCPKQYKFVGDLAFQIDGKNPDFINVNGQKKLIELFGDYWHSKEITGRTRAEEEKQRKEHFAKFGWKTLIIWGSELKDKEEVIKRITDFNINQPMNGQ